MICWWLTFLYNLIRWKSLPFNTLLFMCLCVTCSSFNTFRINSTSIASLETVAYPVIVAIILVRTGKKLRRKIEKQQESSRDGNVPMYLRCLCSIPHREASKISQSESLLNNTPTPKDDFGKYKLTGRTRTLSLLLPRWWLSLAFLLVLQT